MRPFNRPKKADMWVISTAFFLCMIFALIALFAYGPRFSTNDDVIVKAVLNGDISGVHETHLVVRMFLTGIVYKVLYTVAGKTAWYDECVFAFHMLVYFLFLFRIGQLTKKKDLNFRIIAVTAAGLFLCILDFKYLVLHQFTILAAEAGALGIFWFATLREKKKNELIADYIISGCAVIACLYIRQEVFYMLLPFFAVAFFYRMVKKADWSKIVFLLSLLLVVLISVGIEKAAYSSDEWKEFREIHSARIQIYDYYRLPSFEGENQTYRELGIRESDVYPLGEWDLGLFEDYYADGMENLAAFCKQCWERDNALPLKESWARRYIIKKIVPRIFEKPLWPAGWIVFLGSPLVFAIFLRKKKWINAGLVFAVFLYMAVFSGYFIYRGRFPERVSYGLYLMTICLFAGMLLTSGIKLRKLFAKERWTKKKAKAKVKTDAEETEEKTIIFATGKSRRPGKAEIIATSVVLAILAAGVVLQFVNTKKALTEVKNRDADWDAMNVYFTEHPENMYYLKTATFPSCGEAMFKTSTYEKNNFVRLGAWFVKSPIHERYLAIRGGETWKRIRTDENVYYVEDETAGTEWIEKFYEGRGIPVSVEVCDSVDLPSGRKIQIVSIREK